VALIRIGPLDPGKTPCRRTAKKSPSKELKQGEQRDNGKERTAKLFFVGGNANSRPESKCLKGKRQKIREKRSRGEQKKAGENETKGELLLNNLKEERCPRKGEDPKSWNKKNTLLMCRRKSFKNFSGRPPGQEE